MKNILKNNKLLYISSEIFYKGTMYAILLSFSYLPYVEQYGELSLFQSLVTLFLVFITLGMTKGYIVKAYSDDEINFNRLLGTILIFMFGMSILSIILSITVYFYPNKMFNLNPSLITFALLSSVSMIIYDISLTYYIATRSGKNYFRNTLIFSVILVTMTALLYLLVPGIGFYSYIYSKITAGLVMTIIVLFGLNSVIEYKFDKELFKKVLSFSLPLVMHSIGGFVLNYFDRFMLNNMNGLYDSGMYSFAYNFSLVVFVIAVATNRNWVSKFYAQFKEENYEVIDKNIKKDMLFLSLIVIIFSLFTREILYIIFPEKYNGSYYLILLLNINYLIFYCYTLYSNYVFYSGKTYYTFINTTAAGIINIILNYILIPKFGFFGAAYATLISFFILFILYMFTVKRVLKYKTFNFNIILMPFMIVLLIVSLVLIMELYFKYVLIIKIIIALVIIYLVFKRRIINWR